MCFEHGIRCHRSRTFSYERPERNAIVDRQIFACRIMGNPHKVESGRMANEKSEDTLTWNVFRAFQKAGRLGKLAHKVFGLPSDAEPRLYLWGLDLTCDSFPPWKLLKRARQRFESHLPVRRPHTEPDIAFHVPGVYLALIEAKFTSPNGEYVRGPRKNRQSLTFHELLNIYSDPALRILDTQAARSRGRVHYQLWRNMVFAEWMAGHDDPPARAYHFNLVRAGYEEQVTAEFQGLISASFRDRFRRVTWESIYHTAVDEGESLSTLCTYMKQKSANLRPAFRI